MEPNGKVPVGAHQMILQDRRCLEMTGVSDVDSFDEKTVTAYTAMGELIVSGSDLHIVRLNLENGSLSLEGQIDRLEYRAMQTGGFFGRLFR